VPLARTTAGARERWSGHFKFDAPAVYGYWFEAKVGGKTLVFENNATPVYWTREKGAGGAGVVAEMPSSPSASAAIARPSTRPTRCRPGRRTPSTTTSSPSASATATRATTRSPASTSSTTRPSSSTQDWNDKPWRPHSGDGSDDQYSNDFFGGDIAGIIEKLDYIKSVGANTLYITPMFTAASNHKYDTADWKHIDPHFGSNADFERLCREAAKRGIRVLPDASLNHSGADSIYFDRYGTRGGQGAFEGGKINPGVAIRRPGTRSTRRRPTPTSSSRAGSACPTCPS
jgi:cyclomaltodextrinase